MLFSDPSRLGPAPPVMTRREAEAGSGGPTTTAAVERREAPPQVPVRLATGRDFRGRLGTELAIPSLLGAGFGQGRDSHS